MADPSVSFKEERVVKPHLAGINACAISPDGSLIATGSADKAASVIDASKGGAIYTITPGQDVNGVAWHPDGNRLVASCNDGTLTEITRSNGKWSHRSVYKHNTFPYGCAVSPDGLVAIGCGDKCVVILNSNSNYSLKQTINGLINQANRVSFSSNGSLLVIGCADGTHYVYGHNQSNGQYELIIQKKHHVNGIWSLFFSPTDSHLIVASLDKTASLWNVPSIFMTASTWPQSPSFVLSGHTAHVRGACFTGDSSHVITAAEDKTIRIWRVSDGGHVATFNAKDRVCSASFHSPSGRLIGGLKDGTLQSWLCPPYGTSPKSIPIGFVDAHTRLSKAQKDISDIESKLSSVDPSIREAGARAAHLRREIVRLQQQIDEYNKELTTIETDAMKDAIKNIVALEEQLDNAKGEKFNCVFFDQWLFDSGMGHLIGKMKDMDGESLLHITIMDLAEGGLSYIDACDIHIRACMTAHTQTVGNLPNVFNWDATHVTTWLQSQGESYASLVNLGWTGPSLLALTSARIVSASSNTIKGEIARALREAIVSLIKDDSSLPKWMKKWNGGHSVVDYGDI